LCAETPARALKREDNGDAIFAQFISGQSPKKKPAGDFYLPVISLLAETLPFGTRA